MARFTAICLTATIFVCHVMFSVQAQERADGSAPSPVFGKQNLVAWCIVPFDAKKRTPSQRAEMVRRLGLTKVAYDWRQEHVESFEEEIQQYQKHGIEFFAFWSWHDAIAPLIKQYNIRPQIWITCPSPEAPSQQEKIEVAASELQPLIEKTRELGLQLGLYNHGDWGGQPENLVAVCEHIRRSGDAEHVGIVYNFHHGHGHIGDFAQSLQRMQPFLLCLNLNGMVDAELVDERSGKNKILPIGSGKYEKQMMQTIREAGYAGPIGILDHRDELDAEESLRRNLDGLISVLQEQGDAQALASY